GALAAGDLDHHGLLWFVLCTHKSGSESADSGRGGDRSPRARTRNVFLCDQRGDSSGERHYGGLVEDLWTTVAVLPVCRNRRGVGDATFAFTLRRAAQTVGKEPVKLRLSHG